MVAVLLVAGAVLCAIQAIRVRQLLLSALWLAGVSALTSATLYLMGAMEVAVIELSVGTGLVTVLFVFAIGITGGEAGEAREIVPKPLAWLLVVLTAVLIGLRAVPGATADVVQPSTALFRDVLWTDRGLDVLVQIVLISAGCIGVLALVSGEQKTQHAQPPAHLEAQPVDAWALESAAPSAAEGTPAPQPEPVHEEVHA